MSLCTEHKISVDWGMPHAVMGCKLSRVALGFLLFHVFLGASSAVTSVSESPLTRGYVEHDVTMEWTLNGDPEAYSSSSFSNKDDVRIIRHIHDGGDTIGSGYEGRVSFYSSVLRGVGFRLTGLTLGDAGRYRCRYQHTVPIDSSSSLLFIFDPAYDRRTQRSGVRLSYAVFTTSRESSFLTSPLPHVTAHLAVDLNGAGITNTSFFGDAILYFRRRVKKK